MLEPFCLEHDIRVGPEIGSHSTVIGHHNSSIGVTQPGELEDPPGLYEKVYTNNKYYYTMTTLCRVLSAVSRLLDI